jgi:hypothetical protein
LDRHGVAFRTRQLRLRKGHNAWERFGKEVQTTKFQLNRTESTGRELVNVLITQRSVVQIHPPQPKNSLIHKGFRFCDREPFFFDCS